MKKSQMTIKKGDQVKVMRGKDKGKSGAVLYVDSAASLLSVEGLNLVKKRSKPRQQGKKGETVLVARPLSASNVMLICKSCKLPTRIGNRFEGDIKVRYCKKCQAAL